MMAMQMKTKMRKMCLHVSNTLPSLALGRVTRPRTASERSVMTRFLSRCQLFQGLSEEFLVHLSNGKRVPWTHGSALHRTHARATTRSATTTRPTRHLTPPAVLADQLFVLIPNELLFKEGDGGESTVVLRFGPSISSTSPRTHAHARSTPAHKRSPLGPVGNRCTRSREGSRHTPSS